MSSRRVLSTRLQSLRLHSLRLPSARLMVTRFPRLSTRPLPRQAPSGDTSRSVPRAARVGRALLVPLLLAALVTAGTPGWSSYTIRSGDNVESLAKRYHTTVARLVQVNRLKGNGSLIYAGGTLQVPPTRATRAVSRTGVHHYRVVAGDSLIRIAHRYHVKTAVISQANHLPASKMVRIGQLLRVPVTRGATTRSPANTFAGRTYSTAVVRAASRNRARLARSRVPSPSQMRSIIVSSARRNGVEPNLALAVSWQESGWSMRRVSVANAIGAMQVVPSTGAWASGVIGRRLNLLDAHDNVTAGIILLKVLSRTSSTDKGVIAGYYQGLASVRQRGMFADTKVYVANVQMLQRRFARG